MNKKADNTDVIIQNPLINSSVEKMIQVIRDKHIMLDRDLATLYGVETKRINEQVKRNKERFPEDFCFLLTMEETKILRSQNATLEKESANLKGKHSKYRSLAFTEQGIAMLSSVLKSETAIRVNIAIISACDDAQAQQRRVGDNLHIRQKQGFRSGFGNALREKLYIVFPLNKSSIVISCCATLLLAPSATP